VTLQYGDVARPMYREEFFFWFIKSGEWNNKNGRMAKYAKNETLQMYILYLCAQC
jgi:hypothetical protein